MLAKEAYSILTKKYPGVKVVDCYEYDSVFSFLITPGKSRSQARVLDASLCVDKKSGVVRTFKPFDIPIDEYRRGVKISNAVYGGA